MKIGYARVSTDDQNLALQLDALHAAGCEKVFDDTASGARANRKGLAPALDACATGEVLTVWKLNRLGRTLLDLVALVEPFKKRNVGLKVLTGVGASIDTTKLEGRLFFAMFTAFAVFERELLRQRTMAGMKAARRRGGQIDWPRKLSLDQLNIAVELIAERLQSDVAKALGVAVSTLRGAT
jgi:DNA invertase Pin-like site-specific DNA recombinase